jgi:tetratricopeptide (TPR) repeat protein
MKFWSVAVLFTALIAATGCRHDSQVLLREAKANGDKFILQRKYPEAVISYRKAVAIDAKDGPARLGLANAYLLSGEKVSAAREYIRAADLMPDNVSAQVQAGKMLMIAGQYAEAKARAVAALEKEPKNVEVLTLMGNALAGLKDLDGAISHVEEAIDTDPHRTLTYANLGAIQQAKGNVAAAEAAFKRAVDVEPQSVPAHNSLANYYLASNRLSDAERELKVSLGLDPKSAATNRALAFLCIFQNRAEEAETYLKAYAELSTETGPKLILADFYLQMNKTPQALAVLQPLLNTKDGFVPAKLRIAAVDFFANRRPQAYQALDEVFKREPKNELALLEKGRFLLSDEKPTEALAQANLAVTGNPKSVPGHYLRGIALQAAGDNDEAIKAFQQVLQLNPSAVPAQIQLGDLFLTRGDAAAAAEMLGQAVKNQPQSFLAHLLLAKSLLRIRDVNRAEAEATALAKLDARSADVQAVLGDIYIAKGDLSRAKESYSRALAIQPASLEALRGLVRADLIEKNVPAARSRIESRLAAAPNSAPVTLLAGEVYVATGDLDRAETMFRRTLVADPSNIEAYSRLGVLLKRQQRLDDAKREYQQAIQRQPKHAVAARTMVGIICSLQGKADEARREYEQVLAMDPQSPVAANNLAWDYAERGGNLDVALSLAQTAKARMPKSWEASDTLGWIYYKKGLEDLAVTALRQGAEQAPSNAIVHYHLGLAQLKKGSTKDARLSLERALKLDPNFASADDARRVLATVKG